MPQRQRRNNGRKLRTMTTETKPDSSCTKLCGMTPRDSARECPFQTEDMETKLSGAGLSRVLNAYCTDCLSYWVCVTGPGSGS